MTSQFLFLRLWKVHDANVGALISVGEERQSLLVWRHKVLGLHRAAERQVFALQNDALMGELRRAVFISDVRLLHPRSAWLHFIKNSEEREQSSWRFHFMILLNQDHFVVEH